MLPLLCPAIALIPFLPVLLDIAQPLLHLLHHIFVARILAHVVAQLDGRAAVGRSDLDDDVEWL